MEWKSVSCLANKFPEGQQYSIDEYLETISSETFLELVKLDLNQISSSDQSDNFFQSHAGYIQLWHWGGHHYEGYRLWKKFLSILSEINNEKYHEIHKGTPYYHSAIFAFSDDRVIEGFELMDYAVIEDLNNKDTVDNPAGWFVSLSNLTGSYEWIHKSYRDQFSRIIESKSDYYEGIGREEFSKIVKQYFLIKDANSVRSALYIIYPVIFMEHAVNDEFTKIQPKDYSSQINQKVNISKLAIAFETLLKCAPGIMDPKWGNNRVGKANILYQIVNKVLANQNILIIQKDWEKRYGEIEICFKGDILDELIGKREIDNNKLAFDLGLAVNLRNVFTHGFTDTFISGNNYRFYVEKLIWLILWAIKNLYIINI